MYLEKSRTIECPTACPASEVPPPRGKTDTPKLVGDLDHRLHIAFMPRHNDADRLDLIDRRVGGIQQPRVAVEAKIAFDPLLKLRLDLEIISPRFHTHTSPEIRGSFLFGGQVQLNVSSKSSNTIEP